MFMRFIAPGEIDGTARAPPSKSMMQRALAAALLADGESVLSNGSDSEDCRTALTVVRALGADVDEEAGEVTIRPGAREPARRLDCGESGTCMRLFAPIAALSGQETVLTARGSLAKRPMGMLEEAVHAFGAKCQTTDGCAPVRVRGPLLGGTGNVDGSLSSQPISALLIALPKTARDSVLEVRNPASKPYIDMTLGLLGRFGAQIDAKKDLTRFEMAGRQNYDGIRYAVEGDWSGAAFLLVAGAIGGRIRLLGLDADSKQADKAVLDALRQAGAKVRILGTRVQVERGERRPFEFDVSDCPDLAPSLCALAAGAPGVSIIRGTRRLRIKESDRAAALREEFGKAGIRIDVGRDEMRIEGGKIRGADLDSHGDHRIAMAGALLALESDGGMKLAGEECVSKSFPDFFTELEKLKRG